MSLLIMKPSSTIAHELGTATDRSALLKFKESISNDPHGVLRSWNDSVDFCNWSGISCSRRHRRVTALNLGRYDLGGPLSPSIGNISFLRFIILANNSFFGEIPKQVGRLFRLRHLDLMYNSFEGNVPVNLSYCSQLRMLNLGGNGLTGTIPLALSSLVKLVVLNLSRNNLTGGIPAFLGNISLLDRFSVGYNNLVGTVPDELGRLKSLRFLAFVSNNLSGTIPPSLYNISSMSTFSMALNNFNGTLPPNIGFTLPNLIKFAIGRNELSGIIPASFSNASSLKVLDLSGNNFVGQVPASLGNLLDFQWLGLSDNNLGSNSANDLDFIASLTNCSHMKKLEFEYNNFGGVLPNSVANLSNQLTKLNVQANQISGNIPPTLDNLINLIGLGMGGNFFTSVIPASLGKLKNLQVLELGLNSLSGKIPSSIGNLTNIFEISLSHNKLEGTIPSNIAHCQNLQYLDISNNRLTGGIPKEVFGLLSLSILLNLSGNSLIGGLPAEVGKLKNLRELDFSKNNLSSEIPKTMGDCQSLELFYLQENSFQGTLPSSLASLRGLQSMDLSQNNFSGQIPKDLQKLPYLLYLNLSFNDLEGEVPTEGIFLNTSGVSVLGNTKLCGGLLTLKLQRCLIKESKHGKISSLKLTIIIVCVAAFFLLFSSLVILYWTRKSTKKSSSELSKISFLSKVPYKRLYQATNGFSPSMLIGTGSFGSVYKGILDPEEKLVAVKVLNLQQKGASKSFIAECQTLRNVRHRNLVKILTCCSSMDYNGNEFKALIFEYMLNGSLEKWLHLVTESENQSTCLNLIQRLNIAIDVASAIFYLHEECDQPIIHCDLKPSNVLLDNEMIAHVSDFGLARLISNTAGFSESQTSTIGIKGTIGYTPPEYAFGGEPSKQGDVYSYGILMLEMFTGKRPTDEIFKDDFNLHNFVKNALPAKNLQILDSSLLPREVEEITMRREDERRYNNNGGTEIDSEEGNINIQSPKPISIYLWKCLNSVLHIGLACSEESPNERMSMGDVIKELQHIRNAYLGIGIHGRGRTSQVIGTAT